MDEVGGNGASIGIGLCVGECGRPVGAGRLCSEARARLGTEEAEAGSGVAATVVGDIFAPSRGRGATEWR